MKNANKIIGFLFILVGFALLGVYLFIETLNEIPFLAIPVCLIVGILFIFRKKQMLNLLSFGLQNLFKNNTKK